MEHTQITLFKFYCVFYLYISFMIGYSKHELGTINMLYFRPPLLKQVSYYPPPLPPHNGHLSTMATFFCPPRWPLWSGATVLFFLRFYKEIFGILWSFICPLVGVKKLTFKVSVYNVMVYRDYGGFHPGWDFNKLQLLLCRMVQLMLDLQIRLTHSLGKYIILPWIHVSFYVNKITSMDAVWIIAVLILPINPWYSMGVVFTKDAQCVLDSLQTIIFVWSKIVT